MIGLVVAALGGVAAAQPVRFELRSQVVVGQKPAIKVIAAQPVTMVRIELDRDDGKHFSLRHARLDKGQAVTLLVGDGAAGKANYKGTLSATGPDGPWTDSITFETVVRAPIKVTYDVEHLDLDNRRLQFKVSRVVDTAELTVIGDDGTQLGTGSAALASEPANRWVSIGWSQPAGARVMVMKLRVAAADGVVSNVELVPWSVTVEHDDVNFATDSAAIAPGEQQKLDASLAKIADVVKRGAPFMKMQLYVAGHTDTVGDPGSNRKLSVARALAIGGYFRAKGLVIPIAAAGFGEEVLKLKTPQNTDAPANRRADYVIGPAGGAPPFKGPYLKVRAEWKQVR